MASDLKDQKNQVPSQGPKIKMVPKPKILYRVPITESQIVRVEMTEYDYHRLCKALAHSQRNRERAAATRAQLRGKPETKTEAPIMIKRVS